MKSKRKKIPICVNLFCPFCEKPSCGNVIDEDRIMEYQGEKFFVHVNLLKCWICGSEIENPENPCDELTQLYEAYREFQKVKK